MINKLITGICEALNAEFGDEYSIYTEAVEQGLTVPCFFVMCANISHELYRGRRYLRKNQMCVQYFPSEHDRQNECVDILERLFSSLEYITIDGDLQRGDGMRAEFEDGMMSFFINYDFFMDRPSEENEMETLTQSVKARS